MGAGSFSVGTVFTKICDKSGQLLQITAIIINRYTIKVTLTLKVVPRKPTEVKFEVLNNN